MPNSDKRKSPQRPSKEDLKKRYTQAESHRTVWASRLDEMYQYFFPTRARFFNKTKGQSKTNNIFDSTGEIAAEEFANFLKEMLMPTGKQWISLGVGEAINRLDLSDSELNNVKEKLQKDTEILFQYINRSYLDLALVESFREVIAGTGSLIIQEGDIENPLNISSVPMYNLYIGETSQNQIHDFWRVWKLKKLDISLNWPKANMGPINGISDENDISLIEGCVYLPDNDKDYKYYYYVQVQNDNRDIIYESYFDINPFTAFRFDKVSDETYGRGLLEIALPFCKVLNKMAEYDLQSAARIAYPPYIDLTGRSLNPATSRLLPNSLLSIQWNGSGLPIQPLQSGGNLQYADLRMQDLRNIICQILYSNPISEIENIPNRTATEFAIRQQNFIEKSSRAIVRLARECVIPIVQKCVNILRKKGLLEDITLSNGARFELSYESQVVEIEYNSPVVKLENEQKVQSFLKWLQMISQVLAVPHVQTLISENTYQWIAQNLDVDLSIINNPDDAKAAMVKLAGGLQKLNSAAGSSGVNLAQSLGLLPNMSGQPATQNVPSSQPG